MTTRTLLLITVGALILGGLALAHQAPAPGSPSPQAQLNPFATAHMKPMDDAPCDPPNTNNGPAQ